MARVRLPNFNLARPPKYRRPCRLVPLGRVEDLLFFLSIASYDVSLKECFQDLEGISPIPQSQNPTSNPLPTDLAKYHGWRWFVFKNRRSKAIVPGPPKLNGSYLKRDHFKRKGLSSKHYFSGDMLVFGWSNAIPCVDINMSSWADLFLNGFRPTSKHLTKTGKINKQQLTNNS